MQELSFTYESRDYSNYNKDTLHIKRIVKTILKIQIKLIIIMSIIFSVCFTTGLFNGLYFNYWLFDLILLLMFFIFCITVCLLGFTSQYFFGGKVIQQMQKGIAQDVKIIIDDNTVTSDNGNMQASYQWNSIKDIYNKKNNIIIFIADLQAIIIPKRIFRTEEELYRCWNYIQECFNNSKAQI